MALSFHLSVCIGLLAAELLQVHTQRVPPVLAWKKLSSGSQGAVYAHGITFPLPPLSSHSLPGKRPHILPIPCLRLL